MKNTFLKSWPYTYTITFSAIFSDLLLAWPPRGSSHIFLQRKA